MTDRLTKFAATFFYVGDMPVAPGTMASAVTLLICVILASNIPVYVGVFAVITLVGFAVSGRMEKIVGQKDPSCVVIDEAAGMMITLFLLPLTPAVLWTAFFLFRAFDMFKIYPTNLLEKIPGSVGVMTDDLVAGLYANLVMQVAVRITGII